MVVYIHRRRNVNSICEVILDLVNKMDKILKDAPKFLLDDFNHCALDGVLPAYHQYIHCPTDPVRYWTDVTVMAPKHIDLTPC